MRTKLYVGLDLHSNNTYVGILDHQDQRVFKGRFPNNLKVICDVLKPFQRQIVGIVVESTFNWYWLVDGLMAEGYRLHLANPAAIQQYNGIKQTDDVYSSFFLAKLLQLEILPEGYIYPKEERQLRDLLRKRLKLVRQRTTHILSLKSLINRNIGITVSSNQIRTLTENDLINMLKNEHLLLSARTNLDAIRYLGEKIIELEHVILQHARLKPAFEHLLTVTGIGKVLALTISLETGDISRFSEVGHYASYCRCVGSKRISNNKTKGQNNRKNGNQYLAWAFVEAAHFAKRSCPYAEAFFKRKSLQRNKNVAVKALAHKLARACFYILKDQMPYDRHKIFGSPIKTDKGDGSKPHRGLDKSH